MRPAIRSATLFAALFAMLLTALMCLAPRPTAAAGLTLELKTTEDTPQGCLATVLIGNGLGQTLDRFQLDLVLFDGKDGVFDRLLIDLAPLPSNRTTTANIPLHSGACGQISRILLHAVPACRARRGAARDCMTGLIINTHTAIGFSK